MILLAWQHVSFVQECYLTFNIPETSLFEARICYFKPLQHTNFYEARWCLRNKGPSGPPPRPRMPPSRRLLMPPSFMPPSIRLPIPPPPPPLPSPPPSPPPTTT